VSVKVMGAIFGILWDGLSFSLYSIKVSKSYDFLSIQTDFQKLIIQFSAHSFSSINAHIKSMDFYYVVSFKVEAFS
jgi:hypothetical protein